MIIDSITDKSAVDIDKLTIPDVKTESYPTFDLEKDLTESDLESGIKACLNYRQTLLIDRKDPNGRLDKGIFRSFCRLANGLVFFAPDQKPKLELDHEVFDVFAKALVSLRIWDTEQRLRFTVIARDLFPDQLKLVINGGPGALSEIINEAHDTRLWEGFAELAVEIRRLFPGEVVVPTLSSEDWADVQDRIDHISSYHPAGSAFNDLVQMVADLRLVFQGSEERLKLNKDFWRQVRAGLELRRKNGVWYDFFDLAYRLAILAADEAKITPEGGIEVVVHKPNPETKEKIPDMPVKRAF